ncbi:MAG: HdeA family protein [Magnetospirillum sp. WYHS-4]
MRAILILVGLLAATALEAAEKQDVTKITCGERPSIEETMWLVYWIDGYLSGRKGEAKYSDSWVELVGETVEEECKKNPERTLYSIVEERRKRR